MGRVQQRFNIAFGEALGQTTRKLGGVNAQGGIGLDFALAQFKPEKALEAGKFTAGGARTGFGDEHLMRKISFDILLPGIEQRYGIFFAQPLREFQQIAAVTHQGIARQPVFQPQGIAELVEQAFLNLAHD